MKAMQTRLYTNVILTVIAILLAALALQPVMDFTSNAYAQRGFDADTQIREEGTILEDQMERRSYTGDLDRNAEATREIASAIRELAAAMAESGTAAQDSAAAQREIADAIRGLSNL